jgi:hypothetical protein
MTISRRRMKRTEVGVIYFSCFGIRSLSMSTEFSPPKDPTSNDTAIARTYKQCIVYIVVRNNRSKYISRIRFFKSLPPVRIAPMSWLLITSTLLTLTLSLSSMSLSPYHCHHSSRCYYSYCCSLLRSLALLLMLLPC